MDHPEVWYYFCEFVHQDFFVIYGSFQDGIFEFSQSLEVARREELIEHLKLLVNSELTENQLLEEWDKSGAQIAPDDESMRIMFNMFVEMLELR